MTGLLLSVNDLIAYLRSLAESPLPESSCDGRCKGRGRGDRGAPCIRRDNATAKRIRGRLVRLGMPWISRPFEDTGNRRAVVRNTAAHPSIYWLGTV